MGLAASFINADYAFGRDSNKDLYYAYLNCSLSNETCDFNFLNLSLYGLQNGIGCYLAVTNVSSQLSDELTAVLRNLSSANEAAFNASNAGDCVSL